MKRIVLLTAGLLLPLGGALAGEWIVGASLGKAQGDTSASELNSQLTALGLNATASSTEDNRTAWQLTLGYHYTPRWGVEIGYVDLGKIKTSFSGTTTDINTFLVSSSDIHPQTGQGWQMSGLYRHPLTERIAAKAQLGAFAWSSDYTLSSTTASRNVTSRGVSGFAGVGVEYEVLRNTVTHLDYQRYTIDGEPISVISVGLSYRLE
jgi:hypothetical protein